MKISELGEFGLIDLLADIINKNKDAKNASWQKLIVGIGDDAAAWQCHGPIQLATTDSLVQDVHFDLSFTSWEDLGWKAMAANIRNWEANMMANEVRTSPAVGLLPHTSMLGPR